MFNLHKKVIESAGIYKRLGLSIIIDKEGHSLRDSQDIIGWWKQYIEELIEDTKRNENNHTEESTGLQTRIEETKQTIKHQRNGKVIGPDGIPGKLLKLISERKLTLLTGPFNSIYDTGQIPCKWLEAVFIQIPKKQNSKKCKDHRTISLLNHMLELFCK